LRYYLKPAEEFYDLKESTRRSSTTWPGMPATCRPDRPECAPGLDAWMVEQGDTLRVRSKFQSLDYRKEVLDALGPVAEEFEGF
jgi:hypothetical protein